MPSSVPVPERLSRPHTFVVATRDAARAASRAPDGRLLIGPRAGLVQMHISRPLLGRALRILQAVFLEAERRGWRVDSTAEDGYMRRAGVAIVVRDHAYRIELHEQTETIPFTPEEIHAWRRDRARWGLGMESAMPGPQLKRRRVTGRLALMLPDGYGSGRTNWREGVRGPLESKLTSVFRVLEERAERDDIRAEEAAQRAEKLRLKQEHREERARLARIENALAERLEAEITAWERTERTQRYLVALRERLRDLPLAEQQRLEEWCDWAETWATRSDPLRDTSRIKGLNDLGDSVPTPRW